MDRHLAGVGLIYFSGITLAILPPDDAEGLLARLHFARSKGALVAFDSNLRTALWPDKARMQVMVGQAAAVSDLVFPSFDDEQQGFGDATPDQTLDRYLEYGAGAVILKNGAASVQTGSAAARESYSTVGVDAVIDSTGAGDSFNGAFLAE